MHWIMRWRGILTLALYPVVCAAQFNTEDIRRWQDAEGQWHYSDQAPGQMQQIRLPDTETVSTAMGAQQRKEFKSAKRQLSPAHRPKPMQAKQRRSSTLLSSYCYWIQAHLDSLTRLGATNPYSRFTQEKPRWEKEWKKERCDEGGNFFHREAKQAEPLSKKINRGRSRD